MSSKDHTAAQDEDMEELDQVSTVSLLIDDLNSEDPNQKNHSI